METTTDTLQPIIIESKNSLTKESREAIDSVNWKLTILEMAGKYNQDQLDTLEMETELLLCGILSPDEYQKELENRMMLTAEQVSMLLEEMDKLIFKKIQGELEKILARQNIKIPEGRKDTITNDELRMTNENISSKEQVVSSMEEDEVPKPPYVINSKEQVVSSKGNQSSMQEVIGSKEENPIQFTPKSAFEEKLKGPTVSEHTVSDYSKSKTDPYREQF